MEQYKDFDYILFYHGAKFAGRGEPVRMMLDLCGVKWDDPCQRTGLMGPDIKTEVLKLDIKNPINFPPFLLDTQSKNVINQCANIL